MTHIEEDNRPIFTIFPKSKSPKWPACQGPFVSLEAARDLAYNWAKFSGEEYTVLPGAVLLREMYKLTL